MDSLEEAALMIVIRDLRDDISRLRVRVAALENREGSTYDRCDECEQLEAVMVAMIKSLNERITALEKRIDELEASRVIVTHPARPWSITYDTAGNPIW